MEQQWIAPDLDEGPHEFATAVYAEALWVEEPWVEEPQGWKWDAEMVCFGMVHFGMVHFGGAFADAIDPESFRKMSHPWVQRVR